MQLYGNTSLPNCMWTNTLISVVLVERSDMNLVLVQIELELQFLVY